MKEELEVTRGSGNVFRDMGFADADLRQFKAILAAEIIKKLDKEAESAENREDIDVRQKALSNDFVAQMLQGANRAAAMRQG